MEFKKRKLTITKLGPDLKWAEVSSCGKWMKYTELTKKEQEYLNKTGWPQKIPDKYPGPKN